MGFRGTTKRDRGDERDDGLMVFGANPVRELLRSAHPVRRVYVARGGAGAGDEIATLAAARGVVLTEVDRVDLARRARSEHHQGMVAETPGFAYSELTEIIAAGATTLLALDGVQDPRNLGAILRTARAAGVGGVVLPKDRTVGVTGVVVAAAAGLVFGLRIARVTNLARAMDALKEAGYWMVGLSAGAPEPLANLKLPAKNALVVGSEGGGLRRLVAARCDFLARIPMAPGVESLNVSVATGMALYELLLRGRLS